MTQPLERTVGASLVAPAASGLLMVGASGAVCVDGVCDVDPVGHSSPEGEHDAD